MKKVTILAVAVGLALPALPASAQYYPDNHSYDQRGNAAPAVNGNANKSAYDQMMNSINRSGGTAAEYDGGPVGDMTHTHQDYGHQHEQQYMRHSNNPPAQDTGRRQAATPPGYDAYDAHPQTTPQYGGYRTTQDRAGQPSYHDHQHEQYETPAPRKQTMRSGRNVFVPNQQAEQHKQQRRDLERGYDNSYQPVRQ